MRLLDKSTHTAETRKATHTTCPGTNQNCKRVWSPYNLQRITPTISRRMESGKCRKYQRFYQRQRLAFAPMVTKSWGQCGPDLLQFLRNLADHFAPAIFGFSLDKNTPQSSAPSTQQAANYRKLLGQKYNDNRQRISTCIFEGITTRIYGITFNLTCSRQYTKWLSSFDTIGLPLFPILT